MAGKRLMSSSGYRRVRRRMEPKAKLYRGIPSINRGVSFVRTYQAPSWAFDVTTTGGFYRRYLFNMSQIGNDYAQLFDEYKLNLVKISFFPRYADVSPTTTTAAPTANQMYITLAADNRSDPSFIPTGTYSQATYNTMLEVSGTKRKIEKFNKPVSMFVKPQFFDTAMGRMMPANWKSFNSASATQHYSVWAMMHDYAFTGLNSTVFGCDVEFTFYFQCRGYT